MILQSYSLQLQELSIELLLTQKLQYYFCFQKITFLKQGEILKKNRKTRVTNIFQITLNNNKPI